MDMTLLMNHWTQKSSLGVCSALLNQRLSNDTGQVFSLSLSITSTPHAHLLVSFLTLPLRMYPGVCHGGQLSYSHPSHTHYFAPTVSHRQRGETTGCEVFDFCTYLLIDFVQQKHYSDTKTAGFQIVIQDMNKLIRAMHSPY